MLDQVAGALAVVNQVAGTQVLDQVAGVQFNSIQLLYSRLNSIVCIQVVHNNLRCI